jgi:hypothetical protein
VAGLATGSPPGFVIGLIVMSVLLFPGSILWGNVFEAIGMSAGYVPIFVAAFVINLVRWYVVSFVIAIIYDRKTK